jgi:hypothetical protein
MLEFIKSFDMQLRKTKHPNIIMCIASTFYNLYDTYTQIHFSPFKSAFRSTSIV